VKTQRNCRHCNQRKANRPRGLCWKCYHTPGVRGLYPSTSKFAPKSSAWLSGETKPCEPTKAMPGTAEKMEALSGRAERGEELFHRKDATLPSD
jgi:hypothetical protein